MLQIYLLGTFRLIGDRTPIPETAWHTRQARQLLKILLTQRGKIVPRDYLIDALWPDADPTKAATTLRTAINALRNTLEPSRPPYTSSTYIVAHAPGYKFRFTDQVWVDVLVFETLLDQAEETTELTDRQTLLAEALALYEDDYLSDDLYADWAYFERERLRERYLNALTDLAECQAGQEEYERAIASLRRILIRDPGREPVYRALMRYYLKLGNTVAALKTFEQLRTYLKTELEADPSPQTIALHQFILNGQLTRQPLPVISPPAGQSTLETVFVGRRVEIQTLTGMLIETQTKRGQMVSLTGEVGVGKTKLAGVILDRAANQQMITLAARCQVMEQNLPFAPIIEALETFMSRQPDNNLGQLPNSDKAQLAQLLPSLTWQVDFDLAAPVLPEANRQVMVNSLVKTLLHLAERGLILFLDDLQWVDEATLTLLSKLSRRLDQTKILILTAYRAEEVEQNLPLAQFLHSLNRHQLIQNFELPRFLLSEIEIYLQELTLARRSPPTEKMRKGTEQILIREIAQRLHHLTGGNPLFLAETLRSLLDAKPDSLTLTRVQNILSDPALEQPSQPLTDIILARLEQLPPEARTLLNIAAVLGRDFSVDLLEGVATADPLPALTLLLQRQFMTEAKPGRLDFSHHLVREVVYAQLSSLVRQRLHQRVSQALITLYGRQAGSRAAEILEHSLLAGATYRQQAMTFAVLAGDYAMRTFGFEQAARHYCQALDLANKLPPEGELEIWIRQAYQGLGLAQESMGDWDAARDTYEQWQRWAQQHHRPQLTLMAQHRLASLLGLTGQLDLSAAITARISQQLPADIPPVIVDVQNRLNLLISTKVEAPVKPSSSGFIPGMWRGESGGTPPTPPTPSATSIWTDAGWPVFVAHPVDFERPWEEVARFLGDDQAAQSLNLYGWALTLQGQTEAAEATLYYAAQLAEGYNQPGLQATSYHLLAQLWDLRGDYTHMERALDRALALVEDTPRLRWMVIWGLIHQAYVDMRWNQLDRAGQRLQKLDRELARRKALISHRLSVQVGLGLLAMFRDDLEQATHYFELALADFKNLYASNYVVVHLSRARINRKYGRLEAAQQDIMQAMSFAGERGMLADYISAVVETTRFDRATDQPPYMVHLLQQTEAMATRAGLLPARLSVRLALKRVFAQGEAREEAVWYQRLARADRDAIAASIPDPADRTAYLSRRDLKVL